MDERPPSSSPRRDRARPSPASPPPGRQAPARHPPDQPPTTRPLGARPPALLASAASGAAGGALLLIGWLADLDALWLAGVLAGAVSLCIALYWRSQLIAAWRRRPRTTEEP